MNPTTHAKRTPRTRGLATILALSFALELGPDCRVTLNPSLRSLGEMAWMRL